MPNAKEQVRLELTQEQRAIVKNAIGKDAEVIELDVMELEERIAPSCVKGSHLPETKL